MIKRFALLALGLLLLPVTAWAQGACPMGQSQPQIITASSYTLTTLNECNFLIFTSQTPITVTAPVATVLPPSFVVTMTSTLSALTVTTVSTLNNQSAAQSQSVGPFTNMQLIGDGVSNYYLTLAGNYGMQSVLENANATTTAGTTVNNSPTVIMPNGVAKWTNAASFPVNTGPVQLNSNLCKSVPEGGGQAPAVWFLIYDYLGLPRYIPTC